MILLSCLNYFSCGITNKLNYETCVDHAHSLDSAMVACINPLASLSIADIILAMSVDHRRNRLRHNNVDITEFFLLVFRIPSNTLLSINLMTLAFSLQPWLSISRSHHA